MIPDHQQPKKLNDRYELMQKLKHHKYNAYEI